MNFQAALLEAESRASTNEIEKARADSECASAVGFKQFLENE